MLTIENPLVRLRESCADLRRQIEGHALYQEMKTVQDLRKFTEFHVFAVWDFMSLLKMLQQSLTSIAVPWTPSPYPDACRLINEIVLGEESDEYGGEYRSHFEIYLMAMREAGADTGPITRLIEKVRAGTPLVDAMPSAGVPERAQTFVKQTFETIASSKPHVVAAAFAFGREDLIPAMFREIVGDLRRHFEGLSVFEYYLDRHIEVDGDSHGPMALRMIEDLCGQDEQRWQEAATAAREALERVWHCGMRFWTRWERHARHPTSRFARGNTATA